MKKNNKGFSLVELIVVIAIMAVLMVVLTPALLRYVEKTRLQKDNSAIAEIENAAVIACASEKINTEVSTTPAVIEFKTVSNEVVVTFDTTKELGKELATILGDKVVLSSNTYKKATAKPKLTVSVNATTMAVTVTKENIIEDVSSGSSGGTGSSGESGS